MTDQLNEEWQKKMPVFNRHLGAKIIYWREGEVRISAEILPEYCNNSGIAHGGFISALLDMATGHAGIFCPVVGNIRKALTLSLNISYVGQSKTASIYVVGKVTKAGRKTYFSSAEVFDTEDNLIATGQAVCQYRSGSETLQGVPRDS